MKKNIIKKILCIGLAGFSFMMTAPQNAFAAWKKDNIGSWYTEGNSWVTGWRQIDGVWYYFNSDGYMKTGWQYVGGKWYYFNSNGQMESDAVIDGYVLDKDGAMIDSLFVKKEDGNIILKPVNEVNPIGTKEIKFYIVNNKDVEFTSYWNPNEIGPYLLEKYEDGEWKTVRYRSPYDDSECIPAYINILHIKKVHLETIPLDKFDDFDGSKPGKYRIGFSGYYDGSDTSEDIVYTEFEIK